MSYLSQPGLAPPTIQPSISAKPGYARIVELKFFSGLTTEEIAETCGISSAAVVRN